MSANFAYKPRRSVLYVPANNQRALAKASSLDCDVVIYDFEDAVLSDQKVSARRNLSTHLQTSHHQAEIVLRVNTYNSAPFEDDLVWLEDNAQHIDGLLIPKSRSAGEIVAIKKKLANIGVNLSLWLLVETVDAVINLADMTKHLDNQSALVLGAEDLSKEMRIVQTPGRLGLLSVLTQLVLHGRSAGISIIDAAYPNLEQTLVFRQACEQAKNLGFDGKSLIHPNQIAIANEIFSPATRDIQWAQKIIESWHSRSVEGGVVVVEGQVIEKLHVDQALEMLERMNESI